MKRRITTGSAIGCAAVLALSACGSGEEGEQVELRFAWWGSDQRVANTEEVIEAFEQEHPNITISAEYSDFRGYWDQLATQTAGGGEADILQMDLEYFREYAELGALLDLESVPTDQIDEGLLEQGHTEGGQFGIPTGLASVAVIANEAVFDEAGMEIPDDESWTWDDFQEVTAEIQERVGGAYGVTAPFEPFAGLQTWLRQDGKELTTAEGELGIEAQDVVDYFDHLQALDDGASLPSASVIEEDRAASPDQSLIANSGVGMIFGWSNLYPVVSQDAADELTLLRFPSHAGSAEENGMWHRASMFLSASAGTEHPEEAQEFIDFFVNSEESGSANLTDRGLPANSEVREVVLEELGGAELEAAEFLAEIEDEVAAASPVPPMGFGTVADTLHRYQSEVLFNRMTPAEAGEAAYAEIEGNLE